MISTHLYPHLYVGGSLIHQKQITAKNYNNKIVARFICVYIQKRKVKVECLGIYWKKAAIYSLVELLQIEKAEEWGFVKTVLW